MVFSHYKNASFEQCKTETGRTTYDDGIEAEIWLAAVKAERLIDGTWYDGTVTTVLEITETITTLGTEYGTAVHGATTVFDPTIMNDETGISVAHEAGIATGEVQLSGTTTTVGTETTEFDGNEIIDDEITETITVDGTEFGTEDH